MVHSQDVITRFPPSPTGYLHLGSARTALFNWLYARHYGGKFLLRIEDTDRKRSTQEAIDAILRGLEWLDLPWDGDVVFQSERAERHVQVAKSMVDAGQAYFCYATPKELDEMRRQAEAEKRSPKYDRRWRDRDPSTAPKGLKPVIRLKATMTGSTVIEDRVQGKITLDNDQLDDMILVRADGTPTYMLSVVVDDHDMGVNQIIRGDDHLINTFRQNEIYKALGWRRPHVAHVPLIHGSDGAKLSKRHGALGIESYRDQGILPEALCNYLLRLGWSHGDDEIIPREQAIAWFDLDTVGKSPARFDEQKLLNLNGHYLRHSDPKHLLELITPHLEDWLKRPLTSPEMDRIFKGMPGIKERSKTIHDLANLAQIYTDFTHLDLDPKVEKYLSQEGCNLINMCIDVLESENNWNEGALEDRLRSFAEIKNIKFGHIAMPLRAALTKRGISPGVFEVLATLGKEETLSRLRHVIG